MKNCNFRLSEHAYAKLVSQAQSYNISPSEFIRRLVTNQLESLDSQAMAAHHQKVNQYLQYIAEVVTRHWHVFQRYNTPSKDPVTATNEKEALGVCENSVCLDLRKLNQIK